MAVAHGRRREGFTKRLKGGSASMSNMLVPVLQSHSQRVLQLNALPDHLVVLVHGILGRKHVMADLLLTLSKYHMAAQVTGHMWKESLSVTLATNFKYMQVL
jgi:hypothetical protein